MPVSTPFYHARPVRIGSGGPGRFWLVSEFRVRDIAALQWWTQAHLPYPLAALHTIDRRSDPVAWHTELVRIRRSAKAWPPAYGSSEAESAIHRAASLGAFLWAALSRHQSWFSLADAIDLGYRVSAEDFDAVSRVVWAKLPMEEIYAILWPEGRGGRGAGEGLPWEEAVDRLATTKRWTYEDIGDLTLSAFSLACHAGKAAEPGITPRPGQSRVDASMEARRRFYGPLIDEEGNMRATQAGAVS